MKKKSVIPPRPVYVELGGNSKDGYFVTVYKSAAKQPCDELGSMALKNNSDRAIEAARRDAQKLYGQA